MAIDTAVDTQLGAPIVPLGDECPQAFTLKMCVEQKRPVKNHSHESLMC